MPEVITKLVEGLVVAYSLSALKFSFSLLTTCKSVFKAGW